MHLPSSLTPILRYPLRTWFILLASPCMVLPLHAQLREDAINNNTRTSPSEFRAVQSVPSNERLETKGLVAQNTPPAAPAAPAAPATPPAGNPPGGPPGGFGGRRGGGSTEVETMKIDGDKVTLQFPNNTVSDILGIYERLTGKTLIKDTAIFEGQSISLVTPQPVEKSEAIKLIEASLLTNGYAIVADPGGKSSRILTTRTQGNTGGQFSQGVKFYQSANDLPDNETIVSYFMPLSHLDPTEAATMLGGHVGLNSYGRITAVATPPGLLITENANIVKQLVSIKDVIDTLNSASSLVTKFIPLKFADAATVAQIVQATLDAQATDNQTKGLTTIRGQSTAPPSNNSQNNNQQPQQQQSGSSAQISSSKNPKPKASAQVVADSRLNQVLVVAEPDDYIYVASLIAEFDKPVEVPVPYERKLSNIYSVDVLAVLADLLQEAKGGSTQLPGGGTLNQQQQSQTTSSNSFLTGRSGTTNARGGTFSTGSGSSASTDGSGSGVTSRPDQLIESSEDNAPISVLINKTRIIADPLANSIIVIGPKESQDKVAMLLDKLDQKSPQVYLSTVIGKLTLGKGSQIGVDYLQKYAQIGNNSGIASSFITSREDAITNNNISDLRDNLITTAFGPAKGLNIYGQISDTVDVLISALSTSNDFKVLSRPSVFALNNKKAVITSGQSIPVPTQSLTNASSTGNNNNNGNVTTTIEYKDVVLKLEVIPLINPDGNVTLRIAQVNDTVVGSQLIGGNIVPTIGTEQLTTTVTVPDGNTIVIGGLISEQDKKDTEGIPGLSRIPVLGRLFREDVKSKERSELIIFIQPVVVNGVAAMKRASMNEDLRTDVGRDAYKTFPDKVVPRASAEDDVNPANRRRWYEGLFKGKADKNTPAQPPILRKQSGI
ncbi:type II secretion system secretin GspD [soil metagenome]